MSWKVLLTAISYTEESLCKVTRSILEAAGCQVDLALGLGLDDRSAQTEGLAGFDAVVAGIERYDAELFSRPELGGLKMISRWGVGVDSVDLEAATRTGILVANTPGLLDEAVADYAFGMLLACARRIGYGAQSLCDGMWSPAWGPDVFGKTLGIVGLGRIGKGMARRALGFSMKVMAYDPFPPVDPSSLGVEMKSLEELMEESDFVSVHASLTRETRGLIGWELLNRMKSESMLINTARGPIVDEESLVAVLKDRRIGGAALDAFTVEPLAADSPLRDLDNVLITPHQASFGLQTGEAVSRAAAVGVVDAMQGRPPVHLVNPEAWSHADHSEGTGA